MNLRKKLEERARRREMEKAQNSLGVYCEMVHPGYERARHIQFIHRNLESVECGKLPRWALSTPPQVGKTRSVSELFACWYLGRNPRRKVVVATYNDTRAADIGRDVLRVLTDPERRHAQIFPGCEVDRDAASATRVDLTAGGAFYAASRAGSLTGRSADLIVIDDLIKDAAEAASAAVRKECVDWYERVCLTRLGAKGCIVLVGTRWGRSDLFDFLEFEKQEQQRWVFTNLAAIAEGDDPLGRSEGEPLWPERYPLEFLQQRRIESGPQTFKTLYQGMPRAASDAILKLEWFQRYSVVPELRRTIIATDTAFKTGQQNDFSCIQVWGESRTNAAFYLLANWKGRVEFPELQSKLESFFKLWKPEAIVIEDAASGQSLLQVLKASETPMPLKPYRPDRDKTARASAISGYLEAGKIFIPGTVSADFEDEVTGFPLGLHDDQVDTMTMAIGFLIGKPSTLTGWFFGGAARFAELRKQNPAAEPVELALKSGIVPGVPLHAVSLAEAQLRAQEQSLGAVRFKRNKHVFGDLESSAMVNHHVREYRPPNPSACPKCGNSAIAKYDGWSRCVCGWDSRTPDLPLPEPVMLAAKRQSSPLDFLLGKLGF